jgi:hypothetical protein
MMGQLARSTGNVNTPKTCDGYTRSTRLAHRRYATIRPLLCSQPPEDYLVSELSRVEHSKSYADSRRFRSASFGNLLSVHVEACLPTIPPAADASHAIDQPFRMCEREQRLDTGTMRIVCTTHVVCAGRVPRLPCQATTSAGQLMRVLVCLAQAVKLPFVS